MKSGYFIKFVVTFSSVNEKCYEEVVYMNVIDLSLLYFVFYRPENVLIGWYFMGLLLPFMG